MSDTRPERLVVVVGTGTEVGKTWVAAAALQVLRDRGATIAARKPAQSFAPGDASTDADVLGAVTGEPATVVCPPHRWYEVPMAPPMAAAVLDRPSFGLTDLVDEIEWPAGIDVGLVESAGGVRSPLAADDGDSVDLAAALMPDVIVVVADAGLGTINSVRLTVAALDPLVDTRDGLELVVVLNRFDPDDDLHRRNRDWLRDHDRINVLTSIDGLADALGPS